MLGTANVRRFSRPSWIDQVEAIASVRPAVGVDVLPTGCAMCTRFWRAVPITFATHWGLPSMS